MHFVELWPLSYIASPRVVDLIMKIAEGQYMSNIQSLLCAPKLEIWRNIEPIEKISNSILDVFIE